MPCLLIGFVLVYSPKILMDIYEKGISFYFLALRVFIYTQTRAREAIHESRILNKFAPISSRFQL